MCRLSNGLFVIPTGLAESTDHPRGATSLRSRGVSRGAAEESGLALKSEGALGPPKYPQMGPKYHQTIQGPQDSY